LADGELSDLFGLDLGAGVEEKPKAKKPTGKKPAKAAPRKREVVKRKVRR
jgi:hypothetical protein